MCRWILLAYSVIHFEFMRFDIIKKFRLPVCSCWLFFFALKKWFNLKPVIVTIWNRPVFFTWGCIALFHVFSDLVLFCAKQSEIGRYSFMYSFFYYKMTCNGNFVPYCTFIFCSCKLSHLHSFWQSGWHPGYGICIDVAGLGCWLYWNGNNEKF